MMGIVVLRSTSVHAATIQVATCGRAAVGYDPATGNPSVAFPRKSITLIGAGIDQTIITDGQGKNNFPNVPQILWWDTNDNAPARLTGFTFRGGTIVDAFNKGIVFVR